MVSLQQMEKQADVVVIGAGIVGLSSAYFLAQKGLSVIVLEKDGQPNGCSYGNAGFISPSHFVPLAAPGIVAKGLRWMTNPESPFYIKARLSRTLIRWGWQFMRHANQRHVARSKELLANLALMSLDLHDSFAKRTGLPLQHRGILMFCQTQNTLKHEMEIADMAADLGIETRLLTIDQLNEEYPALEHRGAGAVYFPGDAYLPPELFMQQMYETLAGMNVEILSGMEVTDFETTGNKITKVLAGEHAFTADEVVLAAGSYSPLLARHLHNGMLLEAGKGYSVDCYNADLLPEVAYILVEARVAVTPMGDHVRLAGTMEIAGIDRSINPRRVAGFLKSVEAYLPQYKYSLTKDLPVWAGLRPCTPDGLPYLGRDQHYHNLTVATGHAMLGFTLGPATGKLVAAIITGEQLPLDISQLAVNRFA